MNTEVEVEVLRLRSLHACSNAIEWSRGKTWKEAWEQCPRGDWMLWLAAQVGVRRQLVVRAACACARTALRYIPAGEGRPLAAIVAAEQWCEGRATLEDVRAAASDAFAAYAAYYDAAFAASAADAAFAASAADAAFAASAAFAAYAASAADDAAFAANADAIATAKRHAALVRQIIPYRTLRRALSKQSKQSKQ